MKRLFKTLLLFNRYKKSVQKRTDFFDNSFFNAVPDKPLATRNKPHNNQLCADLSRFISAYSVVSHFLRFAWQTTHALVKRATLNNLRYFQIKTISIHALVKRATRHSSYPPSFEFRDFNPRPRKEGDHSQPYNTPRSFHFNPRPRKEGDF